MGLGRTEQYQRYHRVLNRAAWSSRETSRSLNRAVLLSRGLRSEVAAILGRIDRRSVTKVQGQVLTQEILPMY